MKKNQPVSPFMSEEPKKRSAKLSQETINEGLNVKEPMYDKDGWHGFDAHERRVMRHEMEENEE
ncbi:MAG: hypothetical protein QME44_01745 [Thermodesulfobacteriota bacterium]|nr:hypothetical protein [Thermodesulfobacteriota bacterium]